MEQTGSFREILEEQSETARLSGFQNLMQRRIREILLVSSPYDAFVLAEDGKLHELILSEFLEHNLSHAPGICRVATGCEALELARDQRRYNLIVSTMHIDDMQAHEFARAIRAQEIQSPLVLLTYDNRELADLMRRTELSVFDRVFNWQGDFRIFLTIVKYVEDLLNVEADNRAVGVQVIILAEDSIRFYSSYLPMFYSELMRQSQRLISEGHDITQKVFRMRARPKILLATDYEQAWNFYERFRNDVLGVISEFGLPRAGRFDPEAGLHLAERLRAERPDLPVLLQSENREHDRRAHDAGASFQYKNSPTLFQDLRGFLVESYAFGDFVFRMPDGREVGRARNLKALEEELPRIPDESLLYHAERDHFSNWLKARTEFPLAAKLKPYKAAEFRNMQELRSYLIDQIRENRLGSYRGVVVDFDPADFETSVNIARIGVGSIGGKARGLAFIASLVKQFGLRDRYPDVRILVPGTVVLCTSVFDQFMAENGLNDIMFQSHDDAGIRRRFQEARLPGSAVSQLRSYLSGIHYPLAVRSSSILEDSLYQPFAGVYETHMVPNNAPSLEERLDQLSRAIKAVYASTFSCAAKDYVRATNYRLEEEKMAVIIQRVLGNPYGSRFYPHFSGVARSHDSYPTPPHQGEDGIAAVAVGLGQAVVDGSPVLSFCPRYPRQVLQLSDPRYYLKSSQRDFYALDLGSGGANAGEAPPDLIRLPLMEAEDDGVLGPLASTYSAENDALYDGTSRPGVRVVTLASILKHHTFPLAEILCCLLDMGRWGMNSPVEIEFAVNLSPWNGGPKQFGVLQMRPLVLNREIMDLRLEGLDDRDLICRSPKVLGNGRMDHIRDIVFVDPEAFDRGKSREVALEIADTNERLIAGGIPYMLIVLGRLGSREPWLGIPVAWGQISGARVIVEAGFRDMRVEPSQGSHFFQNLTSFQVGYFTINEFIDEGLIDWQWLRSQPAVFRRTYVRHLHFDQPLVVQINGRAQEGVVFKPGQASRGG